MRCSIIIYFCSLAVFGGIPTASADDGDKLALAGERIGQVQLGMDVAKLDKTLGEATTGEGSMGGSAYEAWCSKSADGQMQQTIVHSYGKRNPAGEREHPKVTQILVTSPFFHTPAGVSTTSGLAAIWQEFPDLQYVDVRQDKNGPPLELYASLANGIGFVLERFAQPVAGQPWGKCRAIVIFPRGERIPAPFLSDCKPIG